jgi:hypothetical protein
MSKKRRVAPGRDWPSELKGPFPWKRLKKQVAERFPDVDEDSDEQQIELMERYAKELREVEAKQRVAQLAKFFGISWPQSETDWLRLIFMVCARFEVPGFKLQRKAGAHEKWISRKNQMLFADVMSVVAKMSRPSEVEAVRRIFGDPEKFLNRYSSVKKWRTLHRQFLRAKNEFEELDRIHPGPGSWFRLWSRDEMIKNIIDSYSAEAEKKRRGRVAQKSVPHKNA